MEDRSEKREKNWFQLNEGTTMHRVQPLRLDALSYAFSCVLHLALAVYFGILYWRSALSWENIFLSMSLLFLAIDQSVISYWLQRFSVAPTAIFCALADTLLCVFCLLSLRVGLLFVYAVAATMAAVGLISFRSAIILDAYHRSIASLTSGLLIYLYSTNVQDPLYLTLSLTMLLYAYVLLSERLEHRIEGTLALLSALLNVLATTRLLG